MMLSDDVPNPQRWPIRYAFLAQNLGVKERSKPTTLMSSCHAQMNLLLMKSLSCVRLCLSERPASDAG